MIYLVSLKRYDEFQKVAKHLMDTGKASIMSEIEFISLNPQKRKRQLRKRNGFLKEQLVGLFTQDEISKLTENAPEPEFDTVGEAMKSLVDSADVLLDKLMQESPEALKHAKRIYDAMMAKAIIENNITDALHAVKFLERQIELVQLENQNAAKNVQQVSRQREPRGQVSGKDLPAKRRAQKRGSHAPVDAGG